MTAKTYTKPAPPTSQSGNKDYDDAYGAGESRYNAQRADDAAYKAPRAGGRKTAK